MRIWFQLMASETRSPAFLDAVRKLVGASSRPDSEVTVHGTTRGAFADQYGLLLYYDEREIIENGIKAERLGYDVFALGNSLDPGITALREILKIPVLSMMEVSCFFACMVGEKFGIIGTNEKYAARYRSIVNNYRLSERLAGVDSVGFDILSVIHKAFEDEAIAEDVVSAYGAAGRRLVARGADTIIGAGVHTVIAANAGLRMIEGAVVQDSYALLMRVAEVAGEVHAATGEWSSRTSLYGGPSPDVLDRAREIYGFPGCASGSQ